MQICTAPGVQINPRVFENIVAFLDYRHERTEIYCAVPLQIKNLSFDDVSREVRISWYSRPGKKYVVQAGSSPDQLADLTGELDSTGLTTQWQGTVSPDTDCSFFRIRLADN